MLYAWFSEQSPVAHLISHPSFPSRWRRSLDVLLTGIQAKASSLFPFNASSSSSHIQKTDRLIPLFFFCSAAVRIASCRLVSLFLLPSIDFSPASFPAAAKVIWSPWWWWRWRRWPEVRAWAPERETHTEMEEDKLRGGWTDRQTDRHVPKLGTTTAMSTYLFLFTHSSVNKLFY